MDALASKVGSVVIGVLDMVDAGLVLPVWYGTFVDTYCHDGVRLGYHVIAIAFFLLACCGRALQKQKTRTCFELFPRTGGDNACKLCERLSATMSHYDKSGRRT